MPRIVVSRRAHGDFSRLYQFLLEKDELSATRAVVAIRDAFIPLTFAPLIGRPMPDRPQLRELVIDFGATGYLALYRFDRTADTVTILAIKHQRENNYK